MHHLTNQLAMQPFFSGNNPVALQANTLENVDLIRKVLRLSKFFVYLMEEENQKSKAES